MFWDRFATPPATGGRMAEILARHKNLIWRGGLFLTKKQACDNK